MGTGVPGFSHRDSDGALIQNPTPSHSSYRWYAQQLFNEDDRDNETAAIHVDFNGDGHHSLEIWAGIGRVRSTQGFEKLFETRDSTRRRFSLESRPEWKGLDIALKVILRKDHNVVVESSVLSVSSIVPTDDWIEESFTLRPMERIERASELKIGAFNIQVFGASKSRKDDVMERLVDILTRYDIVLIQEIRDSSGTAILSLLGQLNAENQGDFQISVSRRLGSTDMKEQYAYLYRDSKVSLVDVRLYPDHDNDFERPPYLARFREHQSREDFTLIGIHVDPDEAYYEIESLSGVGTYVKRSMREHDYIILGDLNADCTYLKEHELEELSLYQSSAYTWQITNDFDTTTALSSCAYDRIITHGSTTDWAKSVDVYRFDRRFRLSRDAVRRISDHYPVEVNLRLPSQSGR